MPYAQTAPPIRPFSWACAHSLSSQGHGLDELCVMPCVCTHHYTHLACTCMPHHTSHVTCAHAHPPQVRELYEFCNTEERMLARLTDAVQTAGLALATQSFVTLMLGECFYTKWATGGSWRMPSLCSMWGWQPQHLNPQRAWPAWPHWVVYMHIMVACPPLTLTPLARAPAPHPCTCSRGRRRGERLSGGGVQRVSGKGRGNIPVC